MALITDQFRPVLFLARASASLNVCQGCCSSVFYWAECRLTRVAVHMPAVCLCNNGACGSRRWGACLAIRQLWEGWNLGGCHPANGRCKAAWSPALPSQSCTGSNTHICPWHDKRVQHAYREHDGCLMSCRTCDMPLLSCTCPSWVNLCADITMTICSSCRPI
jgi:hypothetical protein